jgi:hypothetical protein
MPGIGTLLLIVLLFPIVSMDSVARHEQIAETTRCLISLLPGHIGSDAKQSDRTAAYLSGVQAQRAVVAEAVVIAERFLTTDPNSLDQPRRTRFLAALRTLREQAAAANALSPPAGWEVLHQRHVESLTLLATAGDYYATGMDTHDPSQYDRALAALADGRARFDDVGAELSQLARLATTGLTHVCSQLRQRGASASIKYG